MQHPFAGIRLTTAEETPDEAQARGRERARFEDERRLKRDALYNAYSPLVNDLLDALIADCAPAAPGSPGAWQKGSDLSHLYACHISWFAGPLEGHHAAYDEHHAIRRVIEITLEQDGDCHPTGFRVANHERRGRQAHAGLTRAELVAGIKAVLA